MDDSRIPTIPLSKVVDRDLSLTLRESSAAMGNVTLLELLVIANLARRAIPAVAFEIGTFDGRTSLNISANLPEDGRVYTLDLPKSELNQTRFSLAPGETGFVDKDKSGTRFAGTEFSRKIEQLYGDSATFDFTPYYGQNGLIFVDGSHATEYVVKDTATAIRLAAPGAIILWHDYQPDWPDVISTLNRKYESESPFDALRRIEGTSLVMLSVANNFDVSPAETQ